MKVWKCDRKQLKVLDSWQHVSKKIFSFTTLHMHAVSCNYCTLKSKWSLTIFRIYFYSQRFAWVLMEWHVDYLDLQFQKLLHRKSSWKNWCWIWASVEVWRFSDFSVKYDWKFILKSNFGQYTMNSQQKLTSRLSQVFEIVQQYLTLHKFDVDLCFPLPWSYFFYDREHSTWLFGFDHSSWLASSYSYQSIIQSDHETQSNSHFDSSDNN